MTCIVKQWLFGAVVAFVKDAIHTHNTAAVKSFKAHLPQKQIRFVLLHSQHFSLFVNNWANL